MITLLKLSLSASALIAVTVLLRFLLLQRLPKSAFMALWMVAAVRMLLPVSIPIPVTAPVSHNVAEAVYAAVAEQITPPQTMVPVVTSAPAPAQVADMPAYSAPQIDPVEVSEPDTPLTLTELAVIFWVCGAAAAALCFAFSHLRCMRRYREALPAENPVIDAIVRRFGCRRTVQVKICQGVATPLTYGVIRPVILLPKGLEQADEGQLTYILTHELVHIRRLHVLCKYVLTAAACIHWFNPLAWVMYVLAGQDMELACDESVLRLLKADRERYALTLIALEETRGLSPLLSGFGAKAVKERITLIMKYKKKNIISLMLAILLVLGSLTVFAAASEAEPVLDAMDVPRAGLADVFENEPANDGRTELTIGTDGTAYLGGLAPLVKAFNETSEEYHVTVEYYGEMPGWESIRTLYEDLAEGTGPDLLFLETQLTLFNETQYLQDLRPWFEQEADMVIPSLREAVEKTGSELYYLPLSIRVNTYRAPMDLVDGKTDFTMEQAQALVKALGGDHTVFETWRPYTYHLRYLTHIAGQYVDFDALTCDFDNPDFIAILEELANYPYEYAELDNDYNVDTDPALFRYEPLDSIAQAALGNSQYVFAGFPSAGGSGSYFEPCKTVSITSGTSCKEGALAFIRFALGDEGQLAMQAYRENSTPIGLPVNQSVLESLTTQQIDGTGFRQTDADKLLALIASTCEYDDPSYITYIGSRIEAWGTFCRTDAMVSAWEAAAHIQEEVSAYLAGIEP